MTKNRALHYLQTSLIACCIMTLSGVSFGQNYETAPVFSPDQVLSPELLSGPSHKVTDNVTTVGGLYGFSLWSSYGWYYPESLDMLRIRVAEIKALDALTRIQQEPQFLEGLSSQVRGTLEGTGNAIMDPIGTIKKIPLGLGKFGSKVSARMEEGSPMGESGRMTIQSEKRKLAFQLGVDPYSTNVQLQNALNTVASNRNFGALAPRIGAMFIPGGVGIAVSSAQINKTLQEQLRGMTGPQIQQSVREKLAALGCPSGEIERFLNNPGYTPTSRSVIAEAMTGLRNVNGIGQFISAIQEAPRPEVALFHQRRIQMAERFHREKRQLSELRILEDTPVFFDGSGVGVVTLPTDFLYWDETIEGKVKAMRQALGNSACDVYYSRSMSKLASEKLKENGFNLVPYGEK